MVMRRRSVDKNGSSSSLPLDELCSLSLEEGGVAAQPVSQTAALFARALEGVCVLPCAIARSRAAGTAQAECTHNSVKM